MEERVLGLAWTTEGKASNLRSDVVGSEAEELVDSAVRTALDALPVPAASSA